MSGLNRAIILGNVGGDPDIRRTQDGKPIASFSIATSEQWRDKDTGERKERTQWHRIVCFSEGLCKVIEQYVKKGSRLLVEGQIETRKWTDQGGVDRYVTEIVLRGFNASLSLEGGGQRNGPPANDDADRAGARSVPPRNSGSISSGRASDMDDDIPF
ncbi:MULTISPECIES: single-stranded DNA-binding protein [unclassified Bradyrhizobium]|uniref:single-stranded DNA-binding protein n=1 Tax=unclassified Bradyrhizobium TaxID=2631580 RepID=UPI0028E9A810|nr:MULTISPECIES: single-stranded DNA-binding protein [unclassified Bradyrhizobium]